MEDEMMIRPVVVALVTTALLVSPTGAAASSSAGEPSFATTLRPLLEAKMKELRIPGAVIYV